MNAYYSTLSGWLIPVTRAMKSFDIDPVDTLERFCISPSEVNDPEGRVCVQSLGNLFAYCNNKVGSRAYNIEVAKSFHPSVLHALGYAVQSAYSLQEALERCAQYKRVVSNCCNMYAFEEGEDDFVADLEVYRYADSGRQVLTPHMIEAFLATLVQVSRDIVGHDFKPIKIQYNFEPIGTDCEVVSEFFDCPIEYGCDRNAVVMDVEVAKSQAYGSNPVMNQMHLDMLNKFMCRVDKSNISFQIESRIVEELPLGAPSQADVAKQLGLSLRNLQRKLNDQGTCYKELLDNTRKRLTMNYIRQPHMSISEIGYLVGFSNVANFNRAFKRWEGCAPGEYRHRYLSSNTLAETCRH
ncbi:AraC family transcriptional regulator [Grimontia kaedaensis]|uniref:AraC family transcriptional regulator n=1 Tax=Grimontia kaedaensis TaxID=2872157 RepID=A0ABY4WPQ1_9GAMM|nr:AraC family transcriptional regulator [Grimontia kaedaensis]USH01152.1 AraC family transcriptional regulator [Grimontia kaedaensis]